MSRNPSYIIPEEKGKCELCELNYNFESEVCQECFKENTKREITFNPKIQIHWNKLFPLPEGFTRDGFPSEWFYNKVDSVEKLMDPKYNLPPAHFNNILIIWCKNRKRYFASLSSNLPSSLRNNITQTLLKSRISEYSCPTFPFFRR